MDFQFTMSGNSTTITVPGLPVTSAFAVGTTTMSSIVWVQDTGTSAFQVCRIEISDASASLVIRGNFTSGQTYDIQGQITYEV